MAIARIALNGSIEVATPNEVEDIVTRGVDKLRRLKPEGNFRRIPDAVDTVFASAAPNAFVLSFGTPPAGLIWWVSEVTVSYGPINSINGILAGLYLGPEPAQPVSGTVSGIPSEIGVIRTVQAVPGTFTFSRKAMCIHENENMFVYVVDTAGALKTAKAPLVAVASVIEVPSKYALLDTL